MVSISKIAIIGVGLVAATLFFKEAAGSSLTGTLNRTGLAGQSLGSGIQSTLTGVGAGSAKLLDPLFSMVSFFERVGDLFPSNNSGLATGGGVNLDNNSGGGVAPSNIPSSVAGVSSTNGSSWTSTANSLTAKGTFSTPSGWGI